MAAACVVHIMKRGLGSHQLSSTPCPSIYSKPNTGFYSIGQKEFYEQSLEVGGSVGNVGTARQLGIGGR